MVAVFVKIFHGANPMALNDGGGSGEAPEVKGGKVTVPLALLPLPALPSLPEACRCTRPRTRPRGLWQSPHGPLHSRRGQPQGQSPRKPGAQSRQTARGRRASGSALEFQGFCPVSRGTRQFSPAASRLYCFVTAVCEIGRA